MPVCVIVLKESQAANLLKEKLIETKIPILRFQLIKPIPTKGSKSQILSKELQTKDLEMQNIIEPIEIDRVTLLNPKLSRGQRQRNMALWLMPFGFLAGLTFSQMTGLQTFSVTGLGKPGELFLGGLLGMFSGLIGSYAAALSVNTDKEDDVGSLRKKNKQGFWLLLVETPIEIELPWYLIQEIQPIEIVRLRDL